MACAPAAERERAVKEVAQAYERIKMQQPLLLHHHCSGEQQLAHSLVGGEALRALNVALCVMTKQQQPAAALAAPPLTSPGFSDDSKATIATTMARGGKRRRSSSVMDDAWKKRSSSSSSSWVRLTTVPYEDGYEWRKYGEKRINGATHTRSYFRCTYRDDTGCQATKHVQQQPPQGDGAICGDPPMFQVTYNSKHTCCNSRTAAAAAMNGVKQEVEQAPPVVLPHLPPLVEALAFERTSSVPCQEPVSSSSSFPATINMQQLCGGAGLTAEQHYYCHGDTAAAPSSATATSPCIPGDSACDDEYSAGDMMMAQMAAAEAPAAGDHDVDPFYDLELFLLCDSFKDY